MDGASIGAGIAIGFTIGLVTGMESGKGDYKKKLRKLIEAGDIHIQTAAGEAVSIDELDQILKKSNKK